MAGTTAATAADAFLQEILGSPFEVADGIVTGVTLASFQAHCLTSPIRYRDSTSTKKLAALLDDEQGNWEQLSFLDESGGTQYVRTLKAAACVGDINAVEFLMKKDGKEHRSVLLGAAASDKPDIVTLVMNHAALKLGAGGLPVTFVEACLELSSPPSFRRMLRSQELKVGLRELCDPKTYGEMHSHQTVLEHALVNAINRCKDIDETGRRLMHEIKAVNAPKIRNAGPTEVDFAKNRFEQEILDENDRHAKQKKVAVSCFTTALHDFPLHGKEVRRVFVAALHADQDDIIQELLKKYPFLLEYLEKKQDEGGKTGVVCARSMYVYLYSNDEEGGMKNRS